MFLLVVHVRICCGGCKGHVLTKRIYNYRSTALQDRADERGVEPKSKGQKGEGAMGAKNIRSNIDKIKKNTFYE